MRRSFFLQLFPCHLGVSSHAHNMVTDQRQSSESVLTVNVFNSSLGFVAPDVKQKHYCYGYPLIQNSG